MGSSAVKDVKVKQPVHPDIANYKFPRTNTKRKAFQDLQNSSINTSANNHLTKVA